MVFLPPRCGLLLLGTTSLWIVPVGSYHHYSDSFPTVDEYDFTILDPNTLHGSPFGGFSRDTRSRLASLPLPLPSVSEHPSEEEVYMEVRDSDGRLFACRMYHEDELSAKSLSDSMFDSPVLRSESDAQDDTKTVESGEDQTGSVEGTNQDEDDVEEDDDDYTEDDHPPFRKEAQSFGAGANGNLPASVWDTAMSLTDISNAMGLLKGVCLQIHKGWWSYEWCYEKKVTQFHIHIDDPRKQAETLGLRLDDVTVVGTFSTRVFTLAKDIKKPKPPRPNKIANGISDDDDDDDYDDDDDFLDDDDDYDDYEEDDEFEKEEREFLALEEKRNEVINLYSKGEKPIGIVVDKFREGDVCPATNKPREVDVEFRCCSAEAIRGLNSAVIFNGKPVRSPIASIVTLDEPKVCEYHVLVCTPVLCEGKADLVEQFLPPKPGSSGKKKTPKKQRRKRKKNESIREILDRVLEGTCLNTNTNEW